MCKRIILTLPLHQHFVVDRQRHTDCYLSFNSSIYNRIAMEIFPWKFFHGNLSMEIFPSNVEPITLRQQDAESYRQCPQLSPTHTSNLIVSYPTMSISTVWKRKKNSKSIIFHLLGWPTDLGSLIGNTKCGNFRFFLPLRFYMQSWWQENG